uniref:Uncharacterized protein n=1 Tax=Rhizophora mucronata TaxID=61149 RepID=A0A2P2PVL4_RHIMU
MSFCCNFHVAKLMNAKLFFILACAAVTLE